MSRIQGFLRVLIIVGALASVLQVHPSAYTANSLQLVMDHGLARCNMVPDTHEILRLALTAISLSLL